MCKVIEFKQKEVEETTTYSLPTKADIEMVNMIVKNNPDDEMLNMKLWNGGCWKSLMENVFEPYAIEKELDPWDVMALFIMKMNGTEFIHDEDGNLIEVKFAE